MEGRNQKNWEYMGEKNPARTAKYKKQVLKRLEEASGTSNRRLNEQDGRAE